MADVNVYGATWCHDTTRTVAHLTQLGVAFDFRDYDADPAAKQFVLDHNDGKRKLPTVEIVGADVLSIPSNAELDDALKAGGAIT